MQKKFINIMLIVGAMLNASPTCNLRAVSKEGMRAFLVDGQSNAILFAREEGELMFPSSMQKMLLLYLVFDSLVGRDPKHIMCRPSRHARQQEGSRMFVEQNKPVSMEDLINGVVVVSGNDAAVALAEELYGSEEAAAEAMESLAKDLGCTQTTVCNVTGLPNAMQMTTARDLVLIGQKLLEKHGDQAWRFKVKSMRYNNITQSNRNDLLKLTQYGVDGLKTGNTDSAGYGIVFTAEQEGRRLFGVINGCLNQNERFEAGRQLLAFGFSNFMNVQLCKAGQVMVENIPTFLADKQTVEAISLQDFYITVQRRDVKKMRYEVRYKTPVKGRQPKGAHIADLYVIWPSGETKIHPLFLKEELSNIKVWKRPLALLRYWLFG